MALICKGPDCKEVIRPVTPPGGMASRSEPVRVRCPKCGHDNTYSKEEIDKSQAGTASSPSSGSLA